MERRQSPPVPVEPSSPGTWWSPLRGLAIAALSVAAVAGAMAVHDLRVESRAAARRAAPPPARTAGEAEIPPAPPAAATPPKRAAAAPPVRPGAADSSAVASEPSSPGESLNGSGAAVPPAGAVHDLCQRIGRTLASVSVADCLEAGLAASTASSVTGTPIVVREFPPLPARRPLGRVLVVGGIHGDEYSSVSIVFKWMAVLGRHHSGLFHWRVAPLMNPDGLFSRPARRMNANGVDLNRNFPSPNWHHEAPRYWVDRTARNPRRYPGPLPLSEPESRWLVEEIESFQPAVIVSIHAPYNVLDFDGPPEPPKRLGPLQLKLLGTYPGSLGRFAGVHQGIQVVTIELPQAGIMPSEEAQLQIWRDLVAWLRAELSARPDPGRRPKAHLAKSVATAG